MKIDLTKITTLVFIDEKGKRHFIKNIGASLHTQGKEKTLTIYKQD